MKFARNRAMTANKFTKKGGARAKLLSHTKSHALIGSASASLLLPYITFLWITRDFSAYTKLLRIGSIMPPPRQTRVFARLTRWQLEATFVESKRAYQSFVSPRPSNDEMIRHSV